MTYRLFLADGHWLIRKGLRAALQQVDDHEVIGEAADVPSTVARATELSPDIVLLDVRLPDGGGIAAARQIKERRPGQKVLLLSDHGGEDSVRDALRAGCDGYVRKDSSDSLLLEAILCVRAGNVYLDADLSRQLVLADHRREKQGDSGPLAGLSPREVMVFRLIGAGHTNRGAGACMQLSPKTVEKYRASVMQKLKLRSAVDLRLLALELGVEQSSALAQPAIAPTPG
ncbi:MAG: response regulator transcription factor [Burkholderiaceae bacterium]